MKKWMKFVLRVIWVLVLLFGIDLICIFTINRPLFAIRTDNDGSINTVYKGIFYNTYNCAEYSIPQIKAKGSKFTCNVDRTNIGKIKKIVDTTKETKDFSCAEALESFYEDEDYTYYWDCIKNNHMIVKYESGYDETISNALKYGTITIDDLAEFNINYIKEAKEKLSKEDIVAESGLIFSISWKKTDCIPVQLNIYDNGKYDLYTSYEACHPNEPCNSVLKYTESVKGTYDYDVMKIINNSTIADNMSFTNEIRAEFEIYTGNGAKVYMLITNSNNKYLNEFLKQIGVNLKTCADPDYK